ncbi:MAG: polysaccharide pyruvyl transferase family protein [Firmicutes bacterium]|nr:polysaccharide pyruvyl transferase family protein [Bacillota bacterium]
MHDSKAGIITFHFAQNYGAVLQCYALQEFLSNRQCNAFVINHKDYAQERDLKLIQFRSPKRFVKSILLFVRNVAKRLRFNRFRSKHLNLISAEFADTLDLIVLGSDQVWNFDFANTKAYFAEFPKKQNAKVVSYAASIGKDSVSSAELDKYKEKLKGVDMISVRESVAKDALQPLTEKHIDVMIDPTLLLSREQWQTAIGKSLSGRIKKYVLIYSLNQYPETFKIAQKVAKELGLKTIEVRSHGIKVRHSVNKTVTFAGPAEFLRLFQDAEFVVTDSFHGTVFSMIFNKPFYTIPHKKMNSRMSGLLRLVGLGSRLISSENSVALGEEIDYEAVEDILVAERLRATAFIDKALADANGQD